MRSIGRATALIAVLGMPAIAYVLARVSVSMWEGMGSTSLADAGLALEDGLALLAAAVGTVVAAYLALTGYAMLCGAAWRGGRAIPKALASLAPHGWTRVTATALGLSMTAGLAGPALASPAFNADSGSTHSPSAGWVAAPVSVVADATPYAIGWIAPDVAGTPAGSAPSGPQETSHIHSAPVADVPVADVPVADVPLASGASETTAKAPATYIVESGDSLWRITEAFLGTDASASQVAAAWPELYDANREAIGDNPSMIQPGLPLTIPVGLGA